MKAISVILLENISRFPDFLIGKVLVNSELRNNRLVETDQSHNRKGEAPWN
jgi:hypothetical protein